MVNFSAGISALQANQTALGVVAHNIANANTPGFSRREALFQENPSVNINGLFFGQGVSVDVIRRTQNEAAKIAMLGVMSDGAGTELRLETAQQVEAILAPGNGSLLDRFETFFNELERLSAFPDDSALRTTVVRSADSLTSEVRQVSDRLEGYSAQLDLQIQESIGEISHHVNTVAALNSELVRVSKTGDAQDLLDRRDLAVQELAQLVDVKIQSKPGGDFQVLIGGVIPITDAPLNIHAVINTDGQLEIRHPLCEDGLQVTGGQLGGMLAARNDSVGRYQKQLDEMVEVLASQFDTAHASGIGVRDSITQLTSMRDVTNLDVPMAHLDLALPVTAGELFVNVTDAAGQMTTHRIEINPGAQTVRDLGALISEIEGVEAFVPDNGGTFGIIAEDGFSFDFTGNVPEQPFEVSMAGTAVPRMEGRRSEAGNELYEFRFAEDGLVGISDPLPLEVLDGNGQLVTLLNVGAGYDPGAPLEVTPGVFVRIENGSVTAGDSFSSYVVGDPDTSGFLAAAGLNTFFQGNNAKNIQVNEALLANPAMLATTTTGNPSDTTNLQRMVAVRDKRIFSNGTQTLEQYVTDIIAGVGLDVSDLEQIATNNGDLQATLQGQVESSSGVDVNEEVARMLQYQRSLQAAAQYISTQNEVLAELLATIT